MDIYNRNVVHKWDELLTEYRGRKGRKKANL